MRTIWKFRLIGNDATRPPVHAKFRRIGVDDEEHLMAWFEVNDELPMTPEMRLSVIGTGQLIPKGAEWLGSCRDGPFVWHLHEMEPE